MIGSPIVFLLTSYLHKRTVVLVVSSQQSPQILCVLCFLLPWPPKKPELLLTKITLVWLNTAYETAQYFPTYKHRQAFRCVPLAPPENPQPKLL